MRARRRPQGRAYQLQEAWGAASSIVYDGNATLSDWATRFANWPSALSAADASRLCYAAMPDSQFSHSGLGDCCFAFRFLPTLPNCRECVMSQLERSRELKRRSFSRASQTPLAPPCLILPLLSWLLPLFPIL